MTNSSLRFKDVLRELRVNQWSKNAIVFAAFFFAFWDKSQGPLGLPQFINAMFATLLFCLVSSGIYVLNDIRDKAADEKHPVKRKRPVAAGLISVPAAARISFVLLAAGCAGAYLLAKPFLIVVLTYVTIQLIYSYGLKQVALVDILVIAAGFVLRAIAGAVVINVEISSWLLLCTFLLALFLALCKRRHEKISIESNNHEQRASLEKYDAHLLDQLIAITSATTVISYSIYTLWPATVEKFGTPWLGFTIPFVIFGVFRYLDLVYRHEKGDRPEKILLTDLPLIIDMILYAVTIIVIFYLNPSS